MYYVYVLKSVNTGRLYIGRTNNLKRRFFEHKHGKVWTTKRMLPIRLLFYEAYYSKSDSIRRERYFKTNKGKSSLKQIIRDSIKK